MRAFSSRFCFGAFLALCVMGSNSFAVSTVSLDYQPGSAAGDFSSGQGGEFKATLTGSLAAEVAPQPAAVEKYGIAGANQAVFQTFCIQAGVNVVYFNPGATYTASIVTTNLDPLPTNVVAGVSYLFDQFWNGKLDNYNYASNSIANSANLTRTSSAGALQAVIWTLEGDENSSGGTPPTLLTTAESEMASAYGEAGISGNLDAKTQALAWLDDAWGKSAVSTVKILDMVDSSGDYHQAQLVEVVPLPTGASLGFSMLAGLAGLVAFRKLRGRACEVV